MGPNDVALEFIATSTLNMTGDYQPFINELAKVLWAKYSVDHYNGPARGALNTRFPHVAKMAVREKRSFMFVFGVSIIEIATSNRSIVVSMPKSGLKDGHDGMARLVGEFGKLLGNAIADAATMPADPPFASGTNIRQDFNGQDPDRVVSLIKEGLQGTTTQAAKADETDTQRANRLADQCTRVLAKQAAAELERDDVLSENGRLRRRVAELEREKAEAARAGKPWPMKGRPR